MTTWTNRSGVYHTNTTAPCCPGCAAPLTMATAAESKRPPADGDISLCSYCGTAGVWSEGTTALVALDETALDAEDRARLAAVRAMIVPRGDA